MTVDLLTTGVDISDLEFLVFLRPVKSRILFEQMLGRGTRLGDRATGKDHFVVFDCFDGTLIEYFAGTTGITAAPPEEDGKTIPQIIEEIWRNQDRPYNVKRLVRRLRRIDKSMTGEARDLFARFVDAGDLGQFADDLPTLMRTSFGPTMKTLRDTDFQRLLEDYPRGERTFIVAPTVIDNVSSEWLIKGADGKQYKPDDYITVFVDLVRLNASAIDALSILLSRPKDWKPDALLALRDALKRAGLAPLRFHDLRHTFGSLAINYASIVQVQNWMGHADIKTTMRYLHHKSRADEAQVLSQAFRSDAG